MYVAQREGRICFLLKNRTKNTEKYTNANRINDNKYKRNRRKTPKIGDRTYTRTRTQARSYTFILFPCQSKYVKKCAYIRFWFGYPCPANIIITPNLNRYDTANIHFARALSPFALEVHIVHYVIHL